MDLAAGCIEGGGGGGASLLLVAMAPQFQITACKTVSRIWPVFGPSILIDRHTTLECMW